MKKLTGIVFHDEFRTMDQASPRITLWQDGSIDKKAKPALLLIAEDGEQLPEVWTRKEVQQLLFDLYSAAMDGPYLPNSKAMERVALQNKFTL